MKKTYLIGLLAIVLAACKNVGAVAPAAQSGNGTTSGNSMAGKWNIVSVTVIPRDSTGKAINNGAVYTEPSYYYFQFNMDNTWVENLGNDPNNILGESGSYVLHADTTFTLVNVNLPSKPEECKIISLANSSLTFSHQRTTLFNGVTPGYLEYVFLLSR